ncbi:MAG: alpha/beta fold hydrolase [Oligoflexales bacterium]
MHIKQLLFASISILTACKSSGNMGMGSSVKAESHPHAYASLLQLPEGTGYVRLDSGMEISIDLKRGSNGDSEPPIIYLSGIAARQGGSAEDPFLKRLNDAGHTIVKVMLQCQGETLKRDIDNTGGSSVNAAPGAFDGPDSSRDDDMVTPEEQAATLIATLDALGIQAPVHMAGVSYGGGITAATKKLYPNRVAKAFLMAPHATPQASDPFNMRFFNYYSWKNGGWNLFTFPATWIPGAKDRVGFAPSQVLQNDAEMFKEAIYEIWLGIDDFNTPAVISNMNDVHVLAVPGDTVGPPELLGPAMKNNSNGTYQLAVGHDRQHFITGEAPDYAAKWLLERLDGQ